jgi:PAS domain S-box-containing protein
MQHTSSNALKAHLVAVLATLAILLLKLPMPPAPPGLPTACLFLPAVILAAWYGGIYPGLLATLLGILAGGVSFVPFKFSLPVATVGDRMALLAFTGIGGAFSLLGEALHAANRKLAEALRERGEALAALGASEADYRATFELAGVGQAQLEPASARFVRVNRKLCRLTGYPEEELLNLSMPDILHPDDRPRSSASLGAMARGDIPEYVEEAQCLRKDGRAVWVCITATLTRDARGQPLHIVAVIHDTTENRQAQERIVALNQDLKQRLDDLVQAQQALQQADRRKDEFLAMLAHELRNPLAPIRNAVQISRALPPADPKWAWVREVIDRQVNHLARLVDDLLDVSRITRGKIHLHKQRVELVNIVAQAVEAHHPLVESRKHILVVQHPPAPLFLEADATRLIQVIGNLINNAAKYTPEGGRIDLDILREDGEAVIRLRDNGIGIAPEALPHIFDLFTQVERSLDRAQGGLGIGLTLVRLLVEMHGGSVQASSPGPGQGSEFVIRLPLGTGTEPPDCEAGGGNAPRPRATDRTRRILVVDDNIDMAESLSLLLISAGHQVQTVHDGSAALAAALAHKPDVVLLDIGLPGLDGYAIAKRLSRHPETAHALLVAISGYGREEDLRRAQEAGFHHHLIKPVMLEKLNRLLEA